MSDFEKKRILDYENAKHDAENLSGIFDVFTLGGIMITTQTKLPLLTKIGLVVGEIAADVIATKIVNKKLYKKDFHISKYGEEAKW